MGEWLLYVFEKGKQLGCSLKKGGQFLLWVCFLVEKCFLMASKCLHLAALS